MALGRAEPAAGGSRVENYELHGDACPVCSSAKARGSQANPIENSSGEGEGELLGICRRSSCLCLGWVGLFAARSLEDTDAFS